MGGRVRVAGRGAARRRAGAAAGRPRPGVMAAGARRARLDAVAARRARAAAGRTRLVCWGVQRGARAPWGACWAAGAALCRAVLAPLLAARALTYWQKKGVVGVSWGGHAGGGHAGGGHALGRRAGVGMLRVRDHVLAVGMLGAGMLGGLSMLRSMHLRVPAEAACQAGSVCRRAAHVLAAALPDAALGPLLATCVRCAGCSPGIPRHSGTCEVLVSLVTCMAGRSRPVLLSPSRRV